MKKLAKIFAVVLVCALAVTALVACAPKPNTNYDEAKANLEKNKYEVEAIKAGDEGAEEAFAEVLGEVEGIKVEDVEAGLMAMKVDKDAGTADSIMMIWFKNDDAANKYYDYAKKSYEEEKKAAQEYLDEMKKGIDEMEDGDLKDAALKGYEEGKKALDNMVCGKTGLVVYSGTTGGVNATK